MKNLKQSTAYNLMILMVDSTDHITGKTGLTLTITASKAGAAFATITPTVTERGTGWYNLALTTAHTDTLGDLALHLTATGADPLDMVVQVFTTTTDDLVRSTTPANALDVSATGEVGLDFNNIKQAAGGTTLNNITIPTVTSLTNAPLNSAGITSMLVDYARRTGDYATASALATLQGNVTAILADYARRTGDYATVGAAMILTSAYDAAKGAASAAAVAAIPTTPLLAINYTAPISASVIADAVWDEATSGHSTTGTAGKALTDAGASGTPPTVAQIADAVWDEVTSGHSTAGTSGKALTDAGASGTPPTVAQIADAVWDEATSGHLTGGTAGRKLADGATVSDLSGISGGGGTTSLSLAVSETMARSVASGSIAIQSGYTLRQVIHSTTTADLASASKVWFAVKEALSDTDLQALVFMEKSAGLTRVNKVLYATPGNGTLVVTGSIGNWSISLYLDEAASSVFGTRSDTYAAEVKALVSGDTVPVWAGPCEIFPGVVQSYS